MYVWFDVKPGMWRHNNEGFIGGSIPRQEQATIANNSLYLIELQNQPDIPSSLQSFLLLTNKQIKSNQINFTNINDQ